MSKPPKKIREKSKTRSWEKERRNRLKEYFNKLWEVLPIYDKSNPASKADILIHARSTIKDLDEKVQKLLVSSDNQKLSDDKLKVSSDLIKNLQDRLRKLLLRNEQLTNLLGKAGIKVPSERGTVKKFKKSPKYTHAISSERQTTLLQKELEKENRVKGANSRVSKQRLKNIKTIGKSKRKMKKAAISLPNCLFVVSQAGVPNNSCFILSKIPAKVKTVLTNSLMVKAPIVSPDIKSSSITTAPQLPGTIVFTDGTVMPVVPTPKSVPILPAFIANLVPSQFSSIIVVSSTNNANSSCVDKIIATTDISPFDGIARKLNTLGTYSNSLPKPHCKDVLSVLRPRPTLTITTQINKVPIPALSSKYSKHSCLNNKKPQVEDRRKKESCVSINASIGSVKHKLSEQGKMDAEGLKRSSDQIISASEKSTSITISQNPCEKAGDVRGLTTASQSTKKSLDVNEEKSDILRKTCCEKSTATNSQALLYSRSELSIVSQPANKILKNDVAEVPPSDNLPSQSLGKSIDRKVVNAHETTVDISAIPTIKHITDTSVNTVAELKQAKVAVELNKNCFESSNIVTSNSATCSKDYELGAFANITTASMKTVNSSVVKNVNISDSKRLHVNCSQGCFKSCIDTQPNDPLKVNLPLSGSHSRCSDLINSKSLEFHMHNKSCAKQSLKPYNTPSDQTGAIASNLNELKSLEMNISQTELSNDIFASFHVPPGCQNPDSTSPTAAFLLAFPLVSSGAKVAEVIGDENSESQAGTPNLLQIGTMELSKPTQSYSESLTPNLLSFENFSFFNNNKDNCGGFHNNFSTLNNSCQSNISSVTSNSKAIVTLANNPSIQHIDTLDSSMKNIHSKPVSELKSTATVHYNKTETVNKSSSHNNNKIDINVEHSTERKFPNYHQNMGSCSTLSTKVQSIDGVAQSIEKPVTASVTHNINTNILDINSDMFSLKISSNENYLHNKSNNSGDMIGPMYASKISSHVSDYSNLKNCISSTNNFVENKHYPHVYTSAGISNTIYNSFATEGDNRNAISMRADLPDYNNYSDYNRKSLPNTYSTNIQILQKEKTNHNTQPKLKPLQNKPINWMTTPSTTLSYKADYFLPSFSRDPSFNSNTSFSALPSNTYFNSSVYNPNENLSVNQDLRKTSEMPVSTYTSYQRTDAEENQFSWSSNKVSQFLDTTHTQSFVSSTLPTLVGDLALNNTPIAYNKNLKDRNRENRRKTGNCDSQSGQTSFFSVSQLVEQSQESMSAKVASRRISGNRSKANTPKVKRMSGRLEPNKDIQDYQKADKSNFSIPVVTKLCTENKQSSRTNAKNIASSYSAEALIGSQASGESPTKRNNSCQNKTIVPGFFNENMISYFPPAEVSQDNSYVHASPSYQSNSFPQSFTTFQNNSYGTTNYIPSSCTIATSYIPSNNFMSSTNVQDFLGDNTNSFQNGNATVTKEKCNFIKNYYRSDKDDKNQGYSCKKAKKRPLNENVLPSYDIHIFSMPGAVNSPILPDDFHTTYLPPTTLYSSKNPLYSKSNSEATPSGFIPPLSAISGPKPAIQHPEMSPSVNSAGTSLTNFNLSTIFPEINKATVGKYM